MPKMSPRDDKIARSVKQIQNSGSSLTGLRDALATLGLSDAAGQIDRALGTMGDECRAILGLLWDEPEPTTPAPPLRAAAEGGL